MEEVKDMLEESLLPDGQLQFGETISIPHNSYLLKDMRPVSELPLGYKMMIPFPPEWLASISHLSAEDQEKAKTDWANQIETMIKTSMTAEAREAHRLEAIEVGKVQGGRCERGTTARTITLLPPRQLDCLSLH